MREKEYKESVFFEKNLLNGIYFLLLSIDFVEFSVFF